MRGAWAVPEPIGGAWAGGRGLGRWAGPVSVGGAWQVDLSAEAGEVGTCAGVRHTHFSRGTGPALVLLGPCLGLGLGRGRRLDTERTFKKIERL